MPRVSLAIAFFAAGLAFVFPRLFWHMHMEPDRFLLLVLCAPAVLLGARSWLRDRSFANCWPVAMAALLVWAGLAFAEPTESRRGLLYAVKITMVLPIAALVIHQRAWWFCARMFVVGSGAATLLTAWLQYVAERQHAYAGSVRFGSLVVDEGSVVLSNPNEVGYQLAIASMLAFLLHLRAGARAGVGPGAERPPGRFSLAWTVLVSAGCALTASRTAFLGWFVGMGWLGLWATRTQALQRLKDLIGVSVVGVMLAVCFAAAIGFAPWTRLAERLVDDRTINTLGNRTTIWQNAVRAWRSSARHTLVGSGTGTSRELLGQFDEEAQADQYGNMLRSAHSTPLDWLLSYGLLGLSVALWLLVVLAYRAGQLDRRDPVPHRKAILACGITLALTDVIYVSNCWIALGALGLAMLSDPPGRGAARPAPRPATAWPHQLPPLPCPEQQASRPQGAARPAAMAVSRSRP